MNINLKKAFTLVELMMVVIIIGILVTIAIPNYARSVERAKCAQAMGTLKSMRNAMGSWFAQNGTYVGATAATLGDEVYASFDAANPDWTFSVSSATATAYTLNANREGGPWDQSDIIIDELGNFGGSSYPWEDAGNW